jgi:hypothetical protein
MTTHITISGLSVYTNLPAPTVGQGVAPQDVPARDALNAMRSKGMAIHYEQHPLHQLAKSLLHPDELGHLACPEIRNAAREALQ